VISTIIQKEGIVEEYDTGFVPQVVEYRRKITTTWGEIRGF
jgi:hypothetical protein